ncbi:MAG TPA: sulfatase [Candidatus Hydrogenedentes bacterium]|nr:sulfatase [Candidatus Hydrogenedentota bacterium]
MNRRQFMQAAGAVALGAANARAAQPSTPRNVVFYITDDQGMGDAGCYGNPHVRTPGLDELAREGVRFTNAFCTTPSCSPSRSVLLTGTHNHTNGQYGLAHAAHHFSSYDDVKSLPVTLGKAGYRTLGAGKFHTLPQSAYVFQNYIQRADPEEMAEQCRPFLEAKDERPFFLCFCPVEPHRPFHRKGAAPVDPTAIDVHPHLPDIPECRQELAEYYGSIERADIGLKKLIEMLKKNGHWENTLIVYLTDNGMPWPGAKTTLYEPGVNLPCVVRDPRNPRKGYTCNAMVSWLDIMPTILEFCDLNEPACTGRSFLNAMREDDPQGWDEVYFSHSFHEVTMYYPMRGVRTRTHKLIFNIAHALPFPFASDLWKSKTWQAVLERNLTQYGKRSVDAYINRSRFELYDLVNDPHEIKNLAEDPEHQQLLADLKQRIRTMQEKTKDPWLLKWDRE